MIGTEKAFASMSAQYSTRKAFLTYVDPHSMSYDEKGMPYNLFDVWTNRGEDSSKLTWEPQWALMSSSGDMGVTMGPWEYRASRSDSTIIAQGYFSTVWRKHPDGFWKAVFDLGISCPEIQSVLRSGVSKKVLTRQRHRKRIKPSALEKKAWQETKDNGMRSLLSHMDEQAWLNLTGYSPFHGRETIREGLAKIPADLYFESGSYLLSQDRELAVFFGTTHSESRGQKGYLCVWINTARGEWKIALLVIH